MYNDIMEISVVPFLMLKSINLVENNPKLAGFIFMHFLNWQTAEIFGICKQPILLVTTIKDATLHKRVFIYFFLPLCWLRI